MNKNISNNGVLVYLLYIDLIIVVRNMHEHEILIDGY